MSLPRPQRAARYLPPWLRGYRRDWLAGDLTAGVIVTVMLIPQSLAYAMLAGVPPGVGLYASILPLVAYAVFGSSMTLAVGPVALASLMTATALAPLAPAGSPYYTLLASQLAVISGVMLLACGALRLGMLAHFISHPVISGFVSGAAVVITAGQLKPLLGLQFAAQGTVDTLIGVVRHLPDIQPVGAALGLTALGLLVFTRLGLSPLLARLGLKPDAVTLVVRLMPMAVVVAATALVAHFGWDARGQVAVVGVVPAGLPDLHVSLPGLDTLAALWLPALLISVVGFVESVSVAHTLALRRGERIDPDREFTGLGAANLASAFSGGFPVTGGFARTGVNFAAGAHTPLAGVVCALLMAGVLLGATHWFAHLPHAVLAATIIVAVVALIDLKTLHQALAYDQGDALCIGITFFATVLIGVEQGLLAGVLVSFGVLVWRSSHPHMAVVGRVPGTEHFRNIERHRVETLPGVLAVRIDENLFFGNASAVETHLQSLLATHPDTRHLLLIMSAVNRIDTTGLAMLTDLESRLAGHAQTLSMAEIKGPVMERLAPTALAQQLAGRIWLSTHEAFVALASDPTRTP